MKCPICESDKSAALVVVDGYEYFQCQACYSIHIENEVIQEMDQGKSPRRYNESYWQEEIRSAKERSQGSSLVRVGEAILYCRRPVRKFIDVGTGPGFLLDELSKNLPGTEEIFHGVELFPPRNHSSHPNYHEGDVANLTGQMFDAGVCIEVIEHLTPKMLEKIVSSLATISNEGALYLFNTGMPKYVLNEDMNYLDPLNRGHIISYSIEGLRRIFFPYGFELTSLPGKSFAFIAEYNPSDKPEKFEDRIFSPLAENTDLLRKSGLFFQAAIEAAKSYFYYEGYIERTKWALSLNEEISGLKRIIEKMGADGA